MALSRRVRTASALLLVGCILGISFVAAGCLQWIARPVPYQVLGSAAPGGVTAGYEDTLLPLLTKPGIYVLTSEAEWQGLRNALNLGTDAQFYGAVDFSRYLLAVFFHGEGAGMGDRVTIQSLRAGGRRVTTVLGLQLGNLTAIGYPYTVVAIHRGDLTGRGQEPVEWSFDARTGRRQVAATRATVAPPAAGAPLIGWPSPRVLGPGIPQDWAHAGTKILVSRERTAPGDAVPAIFAVDTGQPAGAGDVTVFAPERGTPGSARVSPDGSLVAVMNAVDGRLRLLIAAVDGGSGGGTLPRDLTPAGYTLAAPASWSPDGRSVVVTGRETGGQGQYVLLSIPVTLTGTPGPAQRLFSQSAGLASPTWGPDGTIYFLRQTSQGSVLSARPAASGAGGPPGDIVPAVRYALSPDAQWLAYIAETSPAETSLRVIPTAALIAGGSSIPAGTEVARGQIASPSWSPDGRMLAFTVRPPGRQTAASTASAADLWILRVDSGRTQQLTSGATATEVRFSPDGTQILLALHPGGSVPGASQALVALLDLGDGTTR